MKSILVFLALGVFVAAAPVKDISRIEIRAPDVDSEISDAGFIPADTNGLWGVAHEEDLAAVEAAKHG